MKYQVEKLKMKEIVGGFTERDVNSKALLNTDIDSLLKYKIQKRKMANNNEVEKMRDEVTNLKNEMIEIKELLLTLIKSK